MVKRQALARKRHALVDGALSASSLAKKERELADEQHVVAHQLEALSEELREEAAAVSDEIAAMPNVGHHARLA